MNRRLFTLASIGLNIALAGWCLKPSSTAPSPAAPAPASSPVTEPAPPSFAPPAASTVIRHPQMAPFHWSQLEPQDFARFRDRLREIGCPEITLRALVLSAVHRAYQDRAIAAIQPLQGRFWDLAARVLVDEDGLEEQLKPTMDYVEELKREADKVLESLLGDGNDDSTNHEPDAEQLAQIGNLPPGLQARVLEIQHQFQQLLNQRQREGQWTREKYRAWLLERDAALQSAMNPEEWAEYRLRSSGHTSVRDLRGIELSDDEVRSLVALRKSADEAAAASGDPDSGQYRSARAQYAEAAERALLGDERYSQLERAQSHDYQLARRIGDRLLWDDGVAESVFDVTRAANEAAVQLKRNTGLDDIERAARLDQIRQATERELRSVVPPETFTGYERLSDGWWNSLGQ